MNTNDLQRTHRMMAHGAAPAGGGAADMTRRWGACLALALLLAPWISRAQDPAAAGAGAGTGTPSIEDLERQLQKKTQQRKKTEHAQPAKATPGPADAAGPLALSGPLVDIRAGTFRMGDAIGDGDDDEKPVHEVSIKAFRLGRYEVTRGQFKRFVSATGYRTDADRDEGAKSGCAMAESDHKIDYHVGQSWRDPGFEQTDEHPVVCVSWNDAQAYILWLNQQTNQRFRLPTEAEWEYAARGASSSRFQWGMNAKQGCQFANAADLTRWPANSGRAPETRLECDDHFLYTAPVGSLLANDFGLFDMSGNAAEWTQDCYHANYTGAPADGHAWERSPCMRRVIRGGSWNTGPARLRVAARGLNGNSGRNAYTGFRLAADP
jgi:formylglycine-generating enzyme required for sulfatase activity